ncbi:hypothetical protein CK203_025543 [Vitis vinifera]|uniref:Uncharacterized protein n=1 Tax=Vitis vinifera TaxID=29760 RepID=A0A438IFB5_VITVI|nr:hypothetical protein CK203_025543 [Vitis vinifera]
MESSVLPLEFNRNTDRCIIQSAMLQSVQSNVSEVVDASASRYVVPLEESQDYSWAPLDKLWCALSTSQALIYLMLLMRPIRNHSAHLIKYFEGIDGVNKIKYGYNPAT